MDNLLKQFTQYLDDKIRVLSDILDFNDKQALLLQDEKQNIDEIDVTMADKDGLSDQLVRLNDQFASLFGQLSEQLPAVIDQYEAQLKVIREKNQKVSELEQKVTDSEKRNRALVDQILQKEKQTIKQGRQGSRAAYGYYQNMSGANLGQSHTWDSKQ